MVTTGNVSKEHEEGTLQLSMEEMWQTYSDHMQNTPALPVPHLLPRESAHRLRWKYSVQIQPFMFHLHLWYTTINNSEVSLSFYAVFYLSLHLGTAIPPLCESGIQLSPNSCNGQGCICMLWNEVTSPRNTCKSRSVCTCDTKNWQTKCWTAYIQTNHPRTVFYYQKFRNTGLSLFS